MYYQHGDVLIKKIDELPEGELEKEKRIILAEGEVTGHCHTLFGDLLLLKKGDKVYVKIDGDPAEVIHQEHAPLTIAPGIYEIDKVKEYDHFKEEARRVRD